MFCYYCVPILLITPLDPTQKYSALHAPLALATQQLKVLRAPLEVPCVCICTKHRLLFGRLAIALGNVRLAPEKTMLLYRQLPVMAMLQSRLLLWKLHEVL